MTKYKAQRTYSELCGREFASKLEAKRAEELYLMQMAGEITELEFQKKFILYEKPKITITIDFCYKQGSQIIYEDAKGLLTRDFRSKLGWLKEKYGVDVVLHYEKAGINKVSTRRQKGNAALAILDAPERCQQCGKFPDWRGLSRHHKVKRSKGGDDSKENIIWLCGRCHSGEHGIKELQGE